MTLERVKHLFNLSNWKIYCVKVLKEVFNALYTILAPVYLRPPSTDEERKQVSSEFLELWNRPNAIRTIDSKRVAMECPQNTGLL